VRARNSRDVEIDEVAELKPEPEQRKEKNALSGRCIDGGESEGRNRCSVSRKSRRPRRHAYFHPGERRKSKRNRKRGTFYLKRKGETNEIERGKPEKKR